MTPQVPDARPWLTRRRIVVGVMLLLLAVRVALPRVVRSVLVSRANQALAGRIEVGDVDLWLLRGAVALKDVSLHGDGAGPEAPPLVACRRFYVNVGWLSFLRHTVRLQDIALEGFALNVDRLRTGELVLPSLRPTAAAPPPPPAEEKPPGKPWNIVVDHAALRDGRFRLRDFVVEPPEPVELALATLDVKDVRLQYGAGAGPGRGVVQARFGDGRVRIKTHLATRADGFAIDAKVDVVNLPLDRTQVHVPQLGWNAFTGRLDAAVTLHAEPGATPVAGGKLTLRDLRVDVPGEEEPALAWRRLEVDVETLDVEARRARVRRVALDGAGLLARPREPVPLPVVPHPRREAEGAPPAPSAAEPPTHEAAAPAPWSWRLGALEVTDSGVKIFLEPPPLEIGIVRATVKELSSEPGSVAQVALELAQGDGTLGLEGTVGLDPLAARLTTRLGNLALGPLVAATGAVPARLPGGALSGELRIEAEKEPLTVAGTLALADLAVKPLEGEDFSLVWRRLDLGIGGIAVPGVLPGAERGTKGPLKVDLDLLRLAAPTLALTRTPEGLVLPVAAPADAGAKASPAAAPPASAPPAAAPPASAPPAAASPAPAEPTLRLSLGSLELDGGQVSVVDRAVKPFYRGQVSAIALKARGLRFPENAFDEFSLTFKAPGNAPVSLKGSRGKGGAQLDASLQRLPLRQFNPYVTGAAGYSITKGTATFGSKVHWGETRYDSANHIELDNLALGGVEGDSLFLQRFGIPLSLALGLMRDVHGRIALGVPIRGDRARGAQVDVGAVVAEALAHAIVNAIASPLKLIGALTLEGNKVGAFAPEPVPFTAGRPEIAAEGRPRVEQLGGVLASAPVLRLELSGRAGPADVRALGEAAVLAELQASQGVVGTLRNLPARGSRNAIRDALAARARGEPGELDPDQQKRLDEWVAQKPIADASLRELAAARAERLRALVSESAGVAPDRLSIGEPGIDRDQGRPEVAVSLAAGS